MSLYNELKRRNVFRVAIAYLAGAWLLTEVAGTLFPAFGVPEWAIRFVVIMLALGLVPALIISWAYELTPEGLKREQDVVRDKSITHLTAKRLDGITIGLIVAALAFIALDRLWLGPGSAESLTAPAEVVNNNFQISEPAPAESKPLPNSIAVLPFVNMSDDAGNEYFSDGISEELLNLLTKISGLRVISRSSAFYFKGKDYDMPTIAAQLNVTHVLEGSVRKAGDQVRITAQLIDARTDTHLWSENFDRRLDDIFAIQDEIAAAVVDALKLTLLGDVPKAEEINPEAYALYLQAMYVGTRGTAEAVQQSNAMLKQVLAMAPDYARAWRGLSRNYVNMLVFGLLPRDEAEALSREAIKQALAINPKFAEAHSSLAWNSMADGDLATAARQFEYALSLEPTNLIVIANFSILIYKLGRLDEVIAIMQYVVAHDPLGPIGHTNLAEVYLHAGRPDEAIASARTALTLAPGYGSALYILGRALLLKGENEAALKVIQQVPFEFQRLIGLVMAYHAFGRSAESDAALSKFIGKFEYERPYLIAAVLAYRSEADRAFAWLDKAVQNGDGDLTFIAAEPLFANIQDDPRWLPFLERIGMSPGQLAAIEIKVTLPD